MAFVGKNERSGISRELGRYGNNSKERRRDGEMCAVCRDGQIFLLDSIDVANLFFLMSTCFKI